MANHDCASCAGDTAKKEIAMVTMTEAAWDRAEERHRKDKTALLIALIISIVMIVLTNVVWLLYESQFDVEEIIVESTADGHANYIGQDGDIHNGTSDSTEENAKK